MNEHLPQNKLLTENSIEQSSKQTEHSLHAQAPAIERQVDTHVGKCLRARRKHIGLTQNTLAKQLGITFQQIQKYEAGTNRIFAGRLYQIAKILHVSPSYFFKGLPSQAPENDIELLQTLYRISDKKLKQSLAELITLLCEKHR